VSRNTKLSLGSSRGKRRQKKKGLDERKKESKQPEEGGGNRGGNIERIRGGEKPEHRSSRGERHGDGGMVVIGVPRRTTRPKKG